MSKIFAVAAVVFAAGAASAGIVSTTLVPVDNSAADAQIPGFSTTYDTYDLVIEVEAGDDWTSTSAEATTTGLFYDDALGGDTAVPAFWPVFPALEFDSYYLNTEGPAGPLGFAGAVISDPSFKSATWFDTPPNGGDGVFAVARYTVDEGADLTIVGAHTTIDGGGTLYTYSVTTVPAPGTLALLGLGGLAIRRRR
ncbi:MAG TPA: PEP-CTERM sorting domain-containing protein [Phycisphaeraceae bacterium]|nr:PEP-CTERM sorting domain-containing protein [Phycisphaeraceae bacterium]